MQDASIAPLTHGEISNTLTPLVTASASSFPSMPLLVTASTRQLLDGLGADTARITRRRNRLGGRDRVSDVEGTLRFGPHDTVLGDAHFCLGKPAEGRGEPRTRDASFPATGSPVTTP